MKPMIRRLLPVAVALALSAPALAQDDDCLEVDSLPDGSLIVTTDEGRTFLIQEEEMLEFGPGESGIATEDGIRCLKRPPEFLDWPCASQAAQSRMFNTYSLDDLTQANRMQEIVDRYFSVPEVIAPVPNWIDGEYHGTFNFTDIIQFSSPDYWYMPNPDRPILDGKRPRSLLIALFVGTNQVVLDNNAIDALRKELATDELPVTFVFNDSNTVPISYFGANVSLEEVSKAFVERGIKVAEVPMWWQGDYHLMPTIEEFDKFFDIPALDDIPADRQRTIRAELEAYGFTRKSIIVSLFSESGTMAVDQPERVRMAAAMGMKRIPATLAFYEPDTVYARCGPGTPAGTSGVSGSTTPIGGATVPPTVAPPPIEPPASDS